VFRWSLVAVLFMVVSGVLGVYWASRKPRVRQAQITALTAPVVTDRRHVDIPETLFTEITTEAGITFVHNNGAYGDKLLPETMGGGVAFFDFDNNGAPDLLFINSTYWPGHVPESKQPTSLALFRNEGQGHFRDVTPGSGLDMSCYGMGVAIGD